MDRYTIQIDEKAILHLQNEEGKEVRLTSVLDKIAPRRVIAFEGRMGAGKTTFIKQLCQELGTEDVVNSPTFAIVNVYDIANGEEIYHFDCYRLKDIREAIDFGAEEYLYSGNYCFIEWPDILSPLLPDDTAYIYIDVQEDGRRELRVEWKE